MHLLNVKLTALHGALLCLGFMLMNYSCNDLLQPHFVIQSVIAFLINYNSMSALDHTHTHTHTHTRDRHMWKTWMSMPRQYRELHIINDELLLSLMIWAFTKDFFQKFSNTGWLVVKASAVSRLLYIPPRLVRGTKYAQNVECWQGVGAVCFMCRDLWVWCVF